jgi:hypothetical protein
VIRRIILLLSVATLMVVMLVAMAMPAFAAHKGGVPNEKACLGAVLHAEVQMRNTPPVSREVAQQLGLNNTGEVNKLIKSGELESFNPETGETVACP